MKRKYSAMHSGQHTSALWTRFRRLWPSARRRPQNFCLLPYLTTFLKLPTRPHSCLGSLFCARETASKATYGRAHQPLPPPLRFFEHSKGRQPCHDGAVRCARKDTPACLPACLPNGALPVVVICTLGHPGPGLCRTSTSASEQQNHPRTARPQSLSLRVVSGGPPR